MKKNTFLSCILSSSILGIAFSLLFLRPQSLASFLDYSGGLPVHEATQSVPDERGYWQRVELVEVPMQRNLEIERLRLITQMREVSPCRSEKVTQWVERADTVIVALQRGISSGALDAILQNYPEFLSVVPDPGLGENNYLVEISNPTLESVPLLVQYLEKEPFAKFIEYAEADRGTFVDERAFSSKENSSSGGMISRMVSVEDPFLAESPYFTTHKIDPEVWQMSTGEGVLVAVIDVGFDMDHIDLVENIWINEDEIPENWVDDDGNGYVDDRWGWDFGAALKINGDRFPEYIHDPEFPHTMHGTSIAGVIVAPRNKHFVRGISYRSRVMTLKVFTMILNKFVVYSRSTARALRYAVDNDAQIINYSLDGSDSNAMRKAMEYAQSNEVLVVKCAGNEGEQIYSDDSQWGAFIGKYDNIIVVGVTDNYGVRVDYSNYSQKNVNFGVFEWDGHILNVEHQALYASLGQTSVATAVTSATAALVKSLQPSWNAKKIRNHLEKHVLVYPGLADEFKTSGVLDILGSVKAAHSGHLHFVGPKFQKFTEEGNSVVEYIFERQRGTFGLVSAQPSLYHIDTSPEDFVDNLLPTLTWVDGEGGQKSIAVQIVNDDLPEMNEKFALNIASEGFASVDADFPTVGVNMIDSEGYQLDQVGFFGATHLIVKEDDGTVYIPVNRNYPGREVEVNYSFTPGNADFDDVMVNSFEGKLVWGEGEMGNKTIVVKIVDDNKLENLETMAIKIHNLEYPNLVKDGFSMFYLVIKDNDGNDKGAINFQNAP